MLSMGLFSAALMMWTLTVKPVISMTRSRGAGTARPKGSSSLQRIPASILCHNELQQLDVHDSSGKLVAKLVNEEKEPGSYSISWDGKSSTGDTVAMDSIISR
jgi:hypothetical protein